jgi:hypothetical protein
MLIWSTARFAYNGPAIKGVCVTRRSIRAGSRYFSQEAVTVQGGYGAVFGVMVQVLWALRVSRYKFDGEQIMSHGTVILLTPLEWSAYKLTGNLSRYQEWKQKPWQAY